MENLTLARDAAIPSATSQSLAQRLKALSQRPQSLTVRELIERYMAQYAGLDSTRGQRLSAWLAMIGDFTLEQIDSDLMHAGRAELATKPPLVFMGLDHEGHQIFKIKGRAKTKSTATLILAAFMWSVADFYSGRTFSAQWVPLVNGLVRCFTYALVVLLVSEVRMLLERLRESATVDSLTGLLNRGALLRAGSVEVERARRYHSQLAVVFLDLDNFKTLNDTNGHDVGDKALQATGKAMIESTRRSDYVSRLGGDEFAVVFPAIDFDSAVAAGNKLFKNVNLTLDPYPPVRASIGIAWFQDADREFEAMLKAADEIMYTVKAKGKNNLLVRRYPEATKTSVGSDGRGMR